ncbi:MAG: hypothetical protein DRI97_06300 [Bacteroidetes bacterium]|nr:MAG: hypothetical protein DRI97_06300 [Bacteroidota bacterium]
MVNNWKAAKMLQQFKVTYLDPLIKKAEEAQKILEDPKYKWKKGEKDRAVAKYKRIEGELINFSALHHAMTDLIMTHEGQTDMLTEIYAEWYNKISVHGMQPVEIMVKQQEIMQTIWFRIYAAVKPLELDLNPPKQIEKL